MCWPGRQALAPPARRMVRLMSQTRSPHRVRASNRLNCRPLRCVRPARRRRELGCPPASRHGRIQNRHRQRIAHSCMAGSLVSRSSSTVYPESYAVDSLLAILDEWAHSACRAAICGPRLTGERPCPQQFSVPVSASQRRALPYDMKDRRLHDELTDNPGYTSEQMCQSQPLRSML